MRPAYNHRRVKDEPPTRAARVECGSAHLELRLVDHAVAVRVELAEERIDSLIVDVLFTEGCVRRR